MSVRPSPLAAPCHPVPVMSQLLPVLLGAALAIVGGYLAARWQGQQQRASNLHQAQIALYVDLLAECRWRRVWLDRIAGLHDPGPYEKKTTVYRPALPIDARLDLLGTPALSRAWVDLEQAEVDLDWALNNDGLPRYEGDYVSEGYPGRVRMLAAVDALDASVREALGGSSAVATGRKGWFRVLRAGA